MGQGKKEERKGKGNGVKEGDEEEEGVMDEQRRSNRKEGKKKRKAAKSQGKVTKEKNRRRGWPWNRWTVAPSQAPQAQGPSAQIRCLRVNCSSPGEKIHLQHTRQGQHLYMW